MPASSNKPLPNSTSSQGNCFLCFCFLNLLLLLFLLLAIQPPYFSYSNWNEYKYAIRFQICCSVKIEPHMGIPFPIPPRIILPCNNAGLASNMDCMEVLPAWLFRQQTPHHRPHSRHGRLRCCSS